MGGGGSNFFGAGGAGGVGFGKEADPSKHQSELASIAKSFLDQTKGLRTELISQFMDVLKTGGSQALIPIVSKAVESSKQASSQSQRQTEEELAQFGLAGTPFGAMVRANTRQSADLATSQIPASFAQMFLQMIPSFLQGQGSLGMTGLGQAASLDTQRIMGSLNANTQQLGYMSDLLGGAMGGMSSRELKHDIKSIHGALDRIMQLRGVTYIWNRDNFKSSGVIAEEVQEILPEAARMYNGILHVDALPIIGHLIEAVKELKHEIDYLKGERNG